MGLSRAKPSLVLEFQDEDVDQVEDECSMSLGCSTNEIQEEQNFDVEALRKGYQLQRGQEERR